MGLKVNQSGTWKTVTTPAKYSTDGGTTWITAKRLNFYDPVSDTYMRGVWGDLPPANIVSPTITFTWNGSAYTAVARWTQITDTEGDFSVVQAEKTPVGGSTTVTTTSYSTLTHPAGVTNYALGTIPDAGGVQINWRFRIGDVGGQYGSYTAAPTARVPPSPVTGLTLLPVWNGSKYIVRASWTAPGGTISSYRLVHNKGGGDTTVNGILTTTYDIAGTSNEGGSTYTVSVYSIDADGTASPVTSGTITLPPDPPATISLSGLNTATATLSWTAPTNGIRTGYQYRFSTNGGSTYGGWTSVGSGTLSAAFSIVGVSTLHAQVQTLNTPSGQTNSFEASTSGNVGVPTPVTPTISYTSNSGSLVTWSGSSTTNVSSWTVTFNGSTVAGIASTTTSWPFSMTLANNTSYSATVTAVHTNGQQATSASGSAATASTVSSVAASFVSGSPKADWTHLAGNTNYRIRVYDPVNAFYLVEQVTVGAVGTWTSSSPSLYSANVVYAVQVTGQNANGFATGILSNNAKKIPNPLYIDAIDSETWRDGVDRNVGVLYQGRFDTSTGGNFGAFYYGNAFYDQLNAANLGYTVTINSATIFIMRRDGIGSSAQIAPVFYLHTCGSQADGNPLPNAAGNTAGNVSLTRPANSTNNVPPWHANETFPANWVEEMRDQYLGRKGIGIYTTSTTAYSSFNRSGDFVLFVGTSGTVAVNHSG